jgi:hypothetical protein
MKIIEALYICDVCGEESKSYEKIKSCEQKHRIDKKAKTMPLGSIVCPDCGGLGCNDGTDGVDSHMCYLCGGVGFVICVKATETKYIRIENQKN